jgi:membrane-associated protease RseP (regulator of RpoE activity)
LKEGYIPVKFNELEFVPIILGADITAYSLARSFHEEYGIKSITLSMTQKGYVSESSFIENHYFPNLDKASESVRRLVEVGKEFEGKKKLILFGCGDWYVRTIIENKSKLSQYYIIPYIDGKIDIQKGIYIAQVSLDSPAYEVGIKIGHVITKIDELELTKMSDLRSYIYTKDPGDEIILSLYRNKKELQVKVKLGKK